VRAEIGLLNPQSIKDSLEQQKAALKGENKDE
jgi:hypothetical protein